MRRRRLLLLFLLALALARPAASFAQQETATIIGSVRDESGALVAGATVTVTNVTTNISTSTRLMQRGLTRSRAFAPASIR